MSHETAKTQFKKEAKWQNACFAVWKMLEPYPTHTAVLTQSQGRLGKNDSLVFQSLWMLSLRSPASLIFSLGKFFFFFFKFHKPKQKQTITKAFSLIISKPVLTALFQSQMEKCCINTGPYLSYVWMKDPLCSFFWLLQKWVVHWITVSFLYLHKLESKDLSCCWINLESSFQVVSQAQCNREKIDQLIKVLAK